MITKNKENKGQIQMVSLEQLVPEDHLLRKIDNLIDFTFIYDLAEDSYTCPNGETLNYRTTNREGYREYRSCSAVCESCPYLEKCTKNKSHQKTITRHIWEKYLEVCEEIRLTDGMKDIYDNRKQTIERIFGTAKENHGMRYTHMTGKAKMSMKVGLTFACMNMKKLVKIMEMREVLNSCFA